MDNAAEISAQVSEIMSSILERPIVNNDVLNMSMCAEWTSLKHIEIILSLEEYFQISFEIQDIPKLTAKELIVSKIEGMLHV